MNVIVHCMEDSDQVTETPATQAATETAAQVHARRAGSFGAAAAAYAEFRPSYAVDAIRWALAPVTGQPAERGTEPLAVVDLGAGTGKLTAQLATISFGPRPVALVAIEPDPAMLAELRRRVPGVKAVSGRAEEIPLPDASVDAVVAGQAAHWFDLDLAIPEIARVLRPGGVIGGLWNADDDRVAWVAGLHEASGNRTVVPGPDSDSTEMTDWIAPAGGRFFEPMREAVFSHQLTRTADSLVATLRTHSSFLIMEPEEREAVLGRVRDFLAATPETASGEFVVPMQTLAIRAIRRS
jgi:SAM-dependent methyltransferase